MTKTEEKALEEKLDYEDWAKELLLIAEQLLGFISPSYPGEAYPIDFLEKMSAWFKKEAAGRNPCLQDQIEKNETQINDLLSKIYNIVEAADECFDVWHRLEFGEQAPMSADIKSAYLAGYRNRCMVEK